MSKKTKPQKIVRKSGDRHTKRTVEMFGSRPIVDGPFYSDAMKIWRTQCCQKGKTFDTSCEQSLYVELESDAIIVESLKPLQFFDWQDWISFVNNVQVAAEKGHILGRIYIAGAGLYRDLRRGIK